MNAASWHLLLNHFPIIGTLFSTILFTAGLLLKNNSVKTSGLAFFLLTALLAIPVLLTGEGAEEVLEAIGQDNESLIHHHEEHGEQAFWACQVVGALALASLVGFRLRKKYSNLLSVSIIVAALICSFLMYGAGNSGGQIRHTEIRNTGVDKTH